MDCIQCDRCGRRTDDNSKYEIKLRHGMPSGERIDLCTECWMLFKNFFEKMLPENSAIRYQLKKL